MKMYVLSYLGTLIDILLISDHSRLMSDYEVSLVNDSMQEFYVRFYGPTESTPLLRQHARQLY